MDKIMNSDFAFFLKAIIKDNFNKIVIEDTEEDWVWVRFLNNEGKHFDFKFTKKEIKEFK